MARILIVDDNEQVREVFKSILELEGHHADLAASGYDALTLAVHEQPYHLVLMDLLLDGTANGAAAALALRGLGAPYDAVPIVVVTGGLLPIDEAIYARIRVAGRLLKPVLPDELLAEVARQLATV